MRTLEQENSNLAQAVTMRDAEIKRLKGRAAGQPKGARFRTASARKGHAARS